MLEAVVAIGLLQALSLLAMAGRAKVVAVLLGPEGVGIVGVVDQLVLVVVHLTSASLPFSALTFLSRAHAQGAAAFRRTYLAFLGVLTATTLGGTVLAIALVVTRSDLLGATLAPHQPLVIVALLAVPGLTAASFGASVLAAARRARRSVAVAALMATALLAAAAVGLPLGGLAGLYWASFVASLLTAGLVFASLRRELSLPVLARPVGLGEEIRRHPDLIFFCASYFVVSFAYPFAWLLARQSVLGAFGAAEAGLLQAVIALAAGFGMVLRPVNSQLLLPRVSGQEGSRHKFTETVDIQRRVIVALAALAMPIVLFPRGFLFLLYAEAFTAAGAYVYLFVVAEAIFILAGTYQVLIMGLGDLRMWVLVYVLGYTCLGILAWTLGQRHGLPGVAAAAITAALLVLGLALWRLRQRHGFRLPAGLGRLVLLVLVAIPAAGAAFARYDDGGAVMLLAKMAVLFGVTVGLIRSLDRQDRAWMSHVLGRLSSRTT